jgi:hypothetical protein
MEEAPSPAEARAARRTERIARRRARMRAARMRAARMSSAAMGSVDDLLL